MSRQKLLIVFSLASSFLPFVASAGTIVHSHTYAWSNNVGYISFASTTVSDNALGGYAWSANRGWITMSPAQGGVTNDGSGNLSGSAWGEQLGWIDFGTVSINPSTGRFSGTATGALVGTITFDCPNYCDVETDWRQATAPITPPVAALKGGGGLIANPTPPPALPGVLNILSFNAMMANWGLTQNLAAVGSAFNSADINKDGIVDIFDFNILMVYWGATYPLP